MQAKQIILDTQSKMQKALEFVVYEFGTLHTGRASPTMVENLQVQAYGSTMRLKELASITTPDARTIQVQPYDRSTIRDVEKAIQTANLGFNPKVDGALLRIPLPELTGERRKELAKLTHSMAEEGRVRIRHARREAMETLKKACNDGALPEDDLKRFEKEVQAEHDKVIASIGEAVTRKEKELTTV